MKLSSIIFEGMRAAGLNQKELATKTGVAEATISRYLSGDRIPNIKNLKRIMKIIPITDNVIAYLLD